MFKQCKHCGSPFSASNSGEDYCCAGCQHVHDLIRQGGFENYYALQDQAGRPVGERPLKHIDLESIVRLQEDAEEASDCKLLLSINGMYCGGCAWLIENLCRRHKGVRSANVVLSAGCLSINWTRGEFDLRRLAVDLHNYGYAVKDAPRSSASPMSPLFIRLGLTFLFCLNGLLLIAAKVLNPGSGHYHKLQLLLITACLLFSLFVGGAVFIRPTWRGLLLRRVHRDALPASILMFLFGLALAAQFMDGLWTEYAVIFFIALPLMVSIRCLFSLRVLRSLSSGPE